MGQFVDLTAADGQKIPAYVAQPAGKPKGGIVVVQEIFGVNTHIREVADGLAARQTFVAQLQAEQSAVDNARRARELAEQRYGKGIDSYLAVLDAQRTQLATEQQWLRSRHGQLASEVMLYRALGGGWE